MFRTPTEQDVRRVVDLVIQAVNPVRVILFGSMARGDRDPHDIDLLVVVPDGTNRLEIRDQLDSILWSNPDLDVDVDFVVATPEVLVQYSNSVLSVYPLAMQEGRELYAA